METMWRIPIFGILFLLTLIFGFWLSEKGKPYYHIPFNIHKFIALGSVALSAIQIYDIFKTSAPHPLLVGLIIVAILCVVVLFVSGAFMSMGKYNYTVMKSTHDTFSILAIVSIGIIVYLYGIK